ncbi:1-deoxy-D-xylulose-5-phosphate reductoisomerase [Limnochorda pilosa]|uniref:1-deoxy-D-xylulose 5-phosphate reductoisomerase n=1 Tax=Limnochorda pilosa TaxID=1555112 RepID=A0A0K2SKA6_LIMPI|nr:1-deoxy-D-xylulose-5-phosphate reductoisomerase [Limnochorda pilosa]BAS27530.1 1-deoxy-D-xylulose 5-phosphate reductoisomerase [Limnochorda pilosa]
MSVKRVVLLGATGSIGRQVRAVVADHPGRLELVGMAAGRRVDDLVQAASEQAPGFGVRWLNVPSPEVRERLRRLLPASVAHGVEITVGEAGMVQMAQAAEVDIVVVAVVGFAGLAPTLAALRAGKTVALATKESLVAGGHLVREALQQGGGTLLPVDSEHSALWQLLEGERGRPERLYLTASGGPFRTAARAEMAQATVAQALQHPTWSMGPKITVDSATLMNKGFEVIEARWLFDVGWDRIEVVVHPESVVHALVAWSDGSLTAQLATPHMRLPVERALLFPETAHGSVPALDPARLGALHFEPADRERFPLLEAAYRAGRLGGTYPAVLNAADEVAVQAFLDGRLRLVEIETVVHQVLERHQGVQAPDLEQVRQADQWARQQAEGLCQALAERSGVR